MRSRYALRRASPGGEWDAFVEASPHGSVYALSAFLTNVRDRALLCYCHEGDEIKAAVLLTQREPGPIAHRSELMVYNGVMCAPHSVSGGPAAASTVLESFQVATFIAGELASRYTSLDMQLAPAFIDIRPFLWYNYGTDGPRFAVDVRYTSYLDISDSGEDADGGLPRMRRSRRREMRAARELGVETREEFDPELCVELHRRTLERQSIHVPRVALDEMIGTMRGLHDSGQGRMFVARTADGVAASTVFFGIDSKRAYGMFGGTDPQLRSLPTGTAVLCDAFVALRRSGVREVDFEGINSPRRGWFKLSFGGTVVPYYELSLGREPRAHG